MKINEMKTDEGVVTSFFKGLAGAGTEKALQQEIFVKDFYQDAISSIKNGLASKNILPPLEKQKKTSSNTKLDTSPKPGEVPQMSKNDAAGRIPPDDIQESKFSDLNRIFENIVNLNEENAEYAAAEPMSQYLETWFSNYMRGLNWQPSASSIKRDIKKIEDLYNAGKNYKAAIKNLAINAYSIYQKLGKTPAGLQNVVQGNAPGQPLSGGAGFGQSVTDRLKAVWGKMSKEQRQEFMKFAQENP